LWVAFANAQALGAKMLLVNPRPGYYYPSKSSDWLIFFGSPAKRDCGLPMGLHCKHLSQMKQQKIAANFTIFQLLQILLSSSYHNIPEKNFPARGFPSLKTVYYIRYPPKLCGRNIIFY